MSDWNKKGEIKEVDICEPVAIRANLNIGEGIEINNEH